MKERTRGVLKEKPESRKLGTGVGIKEFFFRTGAKEWSVSYSPPYSLFAELPASEGYLPIPPLKMVLLYLEVKGPVRDASVMWE